MAVRVPSWFSDVLKWRWLTTVALVLASLLYVLCALAFVPTDIRFSAASPSASANPLMGTGLGPLTTPSGTDEVNAEEAAPTDDATPRRRRRNRRRAEAPDAAAEAAAP